MLFLKIDFTKLQENYNSEFDAVVCLNNSINELLEDSEEDDVDSIVSNLSREEKSMIITRAPKELESLDEDWVENIEDLSEEEINERTRRILKASGGKKLLKIKTINHE